MFNLFQAGLPGLKKIDEKLGTGSSGVLEFSSIPATYRSLYLVLIGRTSGAVTSTGVALTFETSPTAGAYNGQILYAANTTITAGESMGANSIYVGNVTGANGPANVPGSITTIFPEYSNTSLYKAMRAENVYADALSSGNFWIQSLVGLYESTAAIDRIRLTLTSGNWTTTSRATLYGLRG